MTRFSAPLKVKREFEDTTVARVDSSGSAVFTGGMRVAGPATFAGAIDTSATARFGAPILAGPASTNVGSVVLVQTTTVLSSTSGQQMTLPSGSQIVDMLMAVQTSASGNAGGMLVRVGTSGDAVQNANIVTSAQGTIYRPNRAAPNIAAASVAGWQSVGASAQPIFVDVTAQTSTTQVDLYRGFLSVFYRMR